MKKEYIRFERVGKVIDGEAVLHNINLSLFSGEVLSLVGLEGSGKSLLVELLTGGNTADTGRIYVNEKLTTIRSQADAINLGIHQIQLRSKLVDGLSIAENVMVVSKARFGKFFLHPQRIEQETVKFLEFVGLDRKPNTIVELLSPFEKHQVEIAKAIHDDAKVILVDDVANEYSPKDLQSLIRITQKLCGLGIAILYTCRILEGITELSHRIAVIRDGTIVRTFHKDEFSTQKILQLLLGQNFSDSFLRKTVPPKETVLAITKYVNQNGERQELELSLRRSEVLSILDLEGDFSNAIRDMLLGIGEPSSGSILLNNKYVQIRNYRDAVKLGIGFIPPTWPNQVFNNLTLEDNLSFLILKKIKKGLIRVSPRLLRFIRQSFLDSISLDRETKAFDNLYGIQKNEQVRIILYRWLLKHPAVLIMEKPSLRIDLLTRQILYECIEQLAMEGLAVLLFATDLSEATAVSDRLLLIRNQKIVGEYTKHEIPALTFEDLY